MSNGIENGEPCKLVEIHRHVLTVQIPIVYQTSYKVETFPDKLAVAGQKLRMRH